MITATWSGGCVPRAPSPAGARSASTGSDMRDVFLLRRQHLVDLLDVVVGQLLHLGVALAVLVLGDLVILLELLEPLHPVAAHIAHGDAGLLGVFVRDLDQLLAAILG